MHIRCGTDIKSSYFDDFISFRGGHFTGFGHPVIVEYLKKYPVETLIENIQEINVLKKKPNIIFKIPLHGISFFHFSHIVVKKCYARNVLKFLISPLRKSKAERSFLAARHLISHGLDTPQPLGFVEKRRRGFVIESYYITEAVEECIKLKKFLRQNPEKHDDIREMLYAVADYIKRMHASGMVHRDLNLANLLICSTGEKRRLILLDLNRYRIRKRVSSFARVCDIGRLYWGLYRTEFFRIYGGENKSIMKWQWFFNYYYFWRKKRRKFKNWLKGG